MRWREEPGWGILKAAAALSLAAGVFTALGPHPDLSPEFLRTVAGIGASLFLAYVIEAAWMATRLVPQGKSGERFMGVLTGFAVCGLAGIVFILTQSDKERSALLASSYFLWWSLLALILLGMMVAIQPSLVRLSKTDDD